LGMTSETVKCEVLDCAKELQNTEYQHIGIGPDQTKKQKQAEIKLTEEANRMNREELTEQDKAKNLKWAVIGPRGEKRLVKMPDREKEGSEGRPVGQRGQRERTRDLDTGEGEKSEDGRGNGGGREASEDQNKTVTVLYTNAQSIGSKIDKLKAITQELEPDIILLTVTWCNNSVGNAALSLRTINLRRSCVKTGVIQRMEWGVDC
jgi:hypothetical protein